MKKPKFQKQTRALTIRLTDDDLKIIKDAAAFKRRPISLWVREACRHVAETQR